LACNTVDVIVEQEIMISLWPCLHTTSTNWWSWWFAVPESKQTNWKNKVSNFQKKW